MGVFTRAWCIAEIAQANLSSIPQIIKTHSLRMVDAHYSSLSTLALQDCHASRPEDKDMILAKIEDIDAFNAHMQWVIFGMQGLFSKWMDGQARAAIIGRIIKRAKTREVTQRLAHVCINLDREDTEQCSSNASQCDCMV